MLDDLIAALPPYAEDVKRTLSACLADETLTADQKWGIAHASAEALAYPLVTRALAAQTPLSAPTQEAIKGAAAVMAMNNIYFRAVHLMSEKEYSSLRAGIRMAALRPSAAAAEIDIDLWTIAISAINGCGACIDIHEASLRKAGGAPAQAQAALKLAAALAGLVAVMKAEEAR